MKTARSAQKDDLQPPAEGAIPPAEELGNRVVFALYGPQGGFQEPFVREPQQPWIPWGARKQAYRRPVIAHGFIVAQSCRDEKEMPHGQAPWGCRFVPMLSVLFRAAFSIRKFPPRGFAPIARDDRALVVGLLGAEGPRGLGMATPRAAWTGQPPLLVIKVCQNYIRSKNPEGPRTFYCFAR